MTANFYAWGIVCSITLAMGPADKPLFDLTVAVLDLASLVSGISLYCWLTYQNLVSIVNMTACGTDGDVSGWAFCLKLYSEIFQLYKVLTVVTAIYLMPGSAKYFMFIIWTAYLWTWLILKTLNLSQYILGPAPSSCHSRGIGHWFFSVSIACSCRPLLQLPTHRW